MCSRNWLFYIENMKKMLAQLLGGLLLLAGGLYIGYLYMVSLNNGGNIPFLIVSILLIGISIFFLIKASNSDNTVIAKPRITDAAPVQADSSNILLKNSQLINDWRKTNDTQNRLKVLQMSATDENSKS